MRIERYMKIIAGQDFLSFDNIPDDLFDLDALMGELSDYNIQVSDTLSQYDI